MTTLFQINFKTFNKKMEYLKNVHGLNDHWSLITQGEQQTRKFLRAGEFFK